MILNSASLVSLGNGFHGVATGLAAAAALLAGSTTLLARLLADLPLLLDHADEVLAHVEALALRLQDLGFGGGLADRRGENETKRGRRGTTRAAAAGNAAAIVTVGTTATRLVVEKEVVVGKIRTGTRLIGGGG